MKILYPLSLIYSLLYKADRYFSNPKKLSKPVISVGNLTLGGTGKTPIVIEILNLLIKNNLKPIVLTRGYSRKNKIPVMLKNGAVGVNVLDSGDEPLLIARSVPKAGVIIGADRYNNALKFESEMIPDIYVLDDGFQHWNIQIDLDIVCINAANPFGNGMLIPAGILREKPTALRRAELIIITNSDMVSYEELIKLEKIIFALSGQRPIVSCYGEFEYKTTDLSTDFSIELLKKSDVYALSAICFAKGFKNSIEKSGIKIKDSIVLRDHSGYSDNKLKKIIHRKGKDSYFIATAKDAVKFQNINVDFKEKIAILTVKPIFKIGKAQWEREVLKRLPFF
ncbi:MAG: tetraacyldisaccharide 4'-kinase [Endomicrobium sp.]|jgi:tetraacyldisaccharide 4'-kinase|nr:tetraacyldisaccharide 4'-kinase [Endomicrobium sp.]